MKHLAFILLLFFSSAFIGIEDNESTCKDILSRMEKAVREIRTLTYRIKKTERVDGELESGEQLVRYQSSPRIVHLKIVAPHSGTEVLWKPESKNKDAKIKPGNLSVVTLQLDPMGNTIRKNNHHTLNEIGFDYFTNLIVSIAKNQGPHFSDYFQYIGEVKILDRICYKIEIDYPQYTYVKYTVKQGETTRSIAHKLYVNEYSIMEKNGFPGDYNKKLNPGSTILVPTAYGKRTLFYIDKENYMPIIQKIYDDQGLYEYYEYHDVKINPYVAQEDFMKELKGNFNK